MYILNNSFYYSFYYNSHGTPEDFNYLAGGYAIPVLQDFIRFLIMFFYWPVPEMTWVTKHYGITEKGLQALSLNNLN